MKLGFLRQVAFRRAISLVDPVQSDFVSYFLKVIIKTKLNSFNSEKTVKNYFKNII
jgi:hypothetical protein